MQSELDGVKKELEVSIKKLNVLRKAHAIEDSAGKKFQYENEIEELEKETIPKLKEKIKVLEQNPPIIPHINKSFFQKVFSNIKNVKQDLRVSLVIGFILGLIAFFANYKLQSLSLKEDNLFSMIMGTILLVGMTLLGTWLIFKAIQYNIFQLKLTTNTATFRLRNKLTSKNNLKDIKKYKSLVEKKELKIKLNHLKNKGFVYLSNLMIIIFLGYSMYRYVCNFWNYGTEKEKHQQIVFNQENFKLSKPTNDSLYYWIILKDIDNKKAKAFDGIDLQNRILTSLNREIDRHSLPIRIESKELDDYHIDSLARICKGVYIIDGYYDSNSVGLTVRDKSIYNDILTFVKVLNMQDSELIKKLDKTTSERRGYENYPIDEELSDNISKEYILSYEVPTKVKYFVMKMIGEMMLKEVSLYQFFGKNFYNNDELRTLTDYTLAIFSSSEKNIIYKINYWGFSPVLSAEFDIPTLFYNMSKLYQAKAEAAISRDTAVLKKDDPLPQENMEKMFSDIEKALKYSAMLNDLPVENIANKDSVKLMRFINSYSNIMTKAYAELSYKSHGIMFTIDTLVHSWSDKDINSSNLNLKVEETLKNKKNVTISSRDFKQLKLLSFELTKLFDHNIHALTRINKKLAKKIKYIRKSKKRVISDSKFKLMESIYSNMNGLIKTNMKTRDEISDFSKWLILLPSK